MITMRVMQMAIMQVIDMASMHDRGVSAIFTMCMLRMIRMQNFVRKRA